MNFYSLLKELCLCPSVSGRESGIRNKISERIAPFCDEQRVDKLGNLIAVKRGTGAGKKLMLAAHMDEIGFMVTFIEDNGYLRIAPVGGVSFAAASHTQVVSESGVRGVLVPEKNTKKPNESFYIDIGAKNAARAKALVSIGDFFVVCPSLTRLSASRVSGRPLDDRVGCAVLLCVAEALSGCVLSGDVYYVFSVQEEVGCRGAGSAAFAVAPDAAICVDVTATGDELGASPMACKIGDGVAVKIKDASVICSEEITTLLCDIAKEQGIKYQREILLFGGTDTSSMQLAGAGCAAGALSIPTRYIHSPAELCDLTDAEAAVRLATEFARIYTKN